jgi:hypothetical protein
VIYVERAADGSIKGLYANSQRGYAEEALDNGDPEVVAFRASQDRKFLIAAKRALALRSLDDLRLADASLNPSAPQSVKDYAVVAAEPVKP